MIFYIKFIIYYYDLIIFYIKFIIKVPASENFFIFSLSSLYLLFISFNNCSASALYFLIAFSLSLIVSRETWASANCC